MRWTIALLLCALPALADEPGMGPIGLEHLKEGRFHFEWGSIDSPPGMSWNYELNTPSDRWHYAAYKLDRKHQANSRVCHLYVFPPQFLNVHWAGECFKQLLPEASPPKFTQSANPLQPSYWSPIQAPGFRGTLVVAGTPQALYCWEELGKDSTPKEFESWLRSFKPTTKKQSFPARNLELSDQLPVKDGNIEVNSGRFTPPPDTVWIEGKVTEKDLEFYQGSRTSKEALDVFLLVLLPESRRLSTSFLDGFLNGLEKSTGQKRSDLQIDTSDPQYIRASFQLGGVPGYLEARGTTAGSAVFAGYGPGVHRQEIAALAQSFQPSPQKVQDSKAQSNRKANNLSFQVALFGGLLVSSFAGAARKTRNITKIKLYKILTVASPILIGLLAFALANRLKLDDEAQSQILGASLGVTAVGLAMALRKKR